MNNELSMLEKSIEPFSLMHGMSGDMKKYKNMSAKIKDFVGV